MSVSLHEEPEDRVLSHELPATTLNHGIDAGRNAAHLKPFAAHLSLSHIYGCLRCEYVSNEDPGDIRCITCRLLRIEVISRVEKTGGGGI